MTVRKIQCPECNTVYRIDESKILNKVVRKKCTDCGHDIVINSNISDSIDKNPIPKTKKYVALGCVTIILLFFGIIFISTYMEKIAREERQQQWEIEQAEELKKKKEEARKAKEEKNELRSRVFKDFLSIPEEELFSKCDDQDKNDADGYMYSDTLLSLYHKHKERFLSDSCNGLYLFKGIALYESGQTDSGLFYIRKSSCSGLNYLKRNGIGLSSSLLVNMHQNCDIVKKEDAGVKKYFENIEREKVAKEREKVNREFKKKVDENWYQFQKDYIKDN